MCGCVSSNLLGWKVGVTRYSLIQISFDMSFLQQQNEFIQFKSEFIFGKFLLRLTLCELHQPFVAMYQCFTLCAHLFFRSSTQLNCLIWLVLLFQGFSVFCKTFLAFLVFAIFHVVPFLPRPRATASPQENPTN